MTIARKRQVSLDATPYYHLVSRCVRRAFLCGFDRFTNRSYEHRKNWLENRFIELAGIFAIDLCAYSVMSNHYHIVVHVDRDKAKNWSDKEVILRWHKLYRGNNLTRQFLKGEQLSDLDSGMLSKTADKWRHRLHDISWFMRCINEPLARKSNKEDECTGRFWEGRYQSHALLDDTALLTCMAYTDLNPVRAGISKQLETSKHTSVRKRIQAARQNKNPEAIEAQPGDLWPFTGIEARENSYGIPFTLTSYLELVDKTGRIQRTEKKGILLLCDDPILDRLRISESDWVKNTTKFGEIRSALVGTRQSLESCLSFFGRSRIVKAFNTTGTDQSR